MQTPYRAVDVRTNDPVTVVFVDTDGPVGVDGLGVVVIYDDDPDCQVSTGLDYFKATGEEG